MEIIKKGNLMNATNRLLSILLIVSLLLAGCSKKEPEPQPEPEKQPEQVEAEPAPVKTEQAPAKTEAPKAGQLGQKAALLEGLTVVKGQPVSFEAGKVYIVEFWATWCGPCRSSIPHLTEVQEKFKDKGLTVIGISKEPVETIKPFVEKMGDQMDYTIASDPQGAVSEGYMKAFGRSGIPSAFIVDGSGKVVWVGHPMGGMDESLEQILAGTFDMEAYAAKIAEEKRKKEQARLEYQKRYGELEKKVAQISEKLKEEPDNAELLLERARTYLGNSFTTELSYNPRHLYMAVQDFKKVLELDPADPHKIAGDVAFFDAWNDRSGARIDMLKAFADKYPDSVRIPFAMYALYAEADKNGNKKEALEFLTIASNAKLEGRLAEFLNQKKKELEAAVSTQ